MRYINSSSEVFNSQVVVLTQTLFNYHNFTKRMKNNLEKLGYVIKIDSGHYKCYYEDKLVTCIASSPSDPHTGSQIIRNFRCFWVNEETKRKSISNKETN